jgi:Amt family ammonium transporter
LTFSHTAGKFIGNLENFCFRGVLAQPTVDVGDLTYAIFQCMFAAITPALAIGAASERGRMLPCMVFIFVWATLVYDPIACWTWNPNGWVYQMGGLDFAGGTPVHISSGSAALAYSIMLGKRRGHGTPELNYRPHNVTHVVIGTLFLWFGWFGFNGGSAVGANLRATMACVVTNLAASVGAFTWVLIDYRLEHKWSAVGWCSGAITGLVAITPASGFVPPWSAVVYGVVGSIACNYATKIKFIIGADDGLDIFAVHAIGGMVGNLLTYFHSESPNHSGFFAADYIAALDGVTVIPGGWLNHNWMQLAYQLCDCITGFSYSFGMTCVILFVMNLTPGLSLRASEESEINGIDESELGEFAYDYVEKERDYIHGPDGIDGAPAPSPTSSIHSMHSLDKREKLF